MLCIIINNVGNTESRLPSFILRVLRFWKLYNLRVYLVNSPVYKVYFSMCVGKTDPAVKGLMIFELSQATIL